MSNIPLTDLYQNKLESGALQQDDVQAASMLELQRLWDDLDCAKMALQQENGLNKWVSHDGSVVQGVYLYGDVGRGKSMLMDLFFESAPSPVKRRVHFHAFMDELHKRMHKLPPLKGVDPLHYVASEIAQEASLLCFDEFYITNIADAMMLGRLFEMLFKCGVVICATSNWSPDNLFKDGFNRQRFKPFITLISKALHVVSLGEGDDWRRKENHKLPLFYSASKSKNKKALQNYYKRENKGKTLEGTVTLSGKKVDVIQRCKQIVWFEFQALCGQPLGANQYLDLARKYSVILLEDIPCFGTEQADQALRFVVLIDALYEHDCQLVCSAACALEELCLEGDVAFAFKRTISRLYEMQNKPV